MRYRPAQYAEALYEALEGKGPEDRRTIARNFARMLSRHRMTAKTSVILASYEKLSLRRHGMHKVRIEATSPVSKQIRKEIHEILGAKIHFEEIENPNLLAGVKILVDDELLIDASAKRQLEKLFIHGN